MLRSEKHRFLIRGLYFWARSLLDPEEETNIRAVFELLIDPQAALIWVVCHELGNKEICDALLQWGSKTEDRTLHPLLVLADRCEAIGHPIAPFFQIWLVDQDTTSLQEPLITWLVEAAETRNFRLWGGMVWVPRKTKKTYEFVLIEGAIYQIRRSSIWVDTPNGHKCVSVVPLNRERSKEISPDRVLQKNIRRFTKAENDKPPWPR